jgi:hypothetical protein
LLLPSVMTLDFSRCRLSPFPHQKEDVQALVEHPYYFIASEMRTGKTAIVIWAAQFLYERGLINKVIVIAPAPVRDVWFDRTLGEIAKHSWHGLGAEVFEFHSTIHRWQWEQGGLIWIISNYEFIRSNHRLTEMLEFCTSKTLLVLDESSFINNYDSAQTKACFQLRRRCGRVVLLNGTPIFSSPLNLFSQGNLLHPSILDCRFVTQFKSRYAIQVPVLGPGGKPLMSPYPKRERQPDGSIKLIPQKLVEVAGWSEEGLADLQRRFAPYTVRRLQNELDLPPKLDPVTLTATLTPATWKTYKSMRDDMVVWLQNDRVASAQTAAIKVMRLSQVTSGFVGGIEPTIMEWEEVDLLTDTLRDDYALDYGESRPNRYAAVETVGREKLDVLLWFLAQRLEQDDHLHVVAWCRFRPEMQRVLDEVTAKFPQFQTAAICGGQKKAERLRALSLLKPETSPTGPVFVVGIEGTGSYGLDMTAAHTCITLSSGYSLGKSAQTLDRVYGPNQTQPIAYYEVIAAGPKGQRTIDHDIVLAKRSGEDVARRTVDGWIRAMTEG